MRKGLIQTQILSLKEETKDINLKKMNYLEIIKEYHLLLINLLAMIGGLIFSSYFFKIGYLPAVKLDELIFLFIIAGLIGLYVSFISVGSLIFPAYVFESFKIKRLKEIIYSDNVNDDLKIKNLLLLIPTSIFFLIVLGLSYLSFNKLISNTQSFIICFLAMFFLAVIVFYIRMNQVKKTYSFFNFFTYFLILSSSLFFTSIPFIITYAYLTNSEFLMRISENLVT